MDVVIEDGFGPSQDDGAPVAPGATAGVARNTAIFSIATGASRVAVACPFCYVMLEDGVKGEGNENVQVQDIAEILVEAIERGELATAPTTASFEPGL